MKKRKYLQRISLLLGCLFIFNLAYPATADAADALRTVLAEIRAEQDAADKIPLSKNLDDSYFEFSKAFDPENKYSMPYFFGTVGILYNKNKVDANDVKSWDIIWNKKYKDQIIMEDSVRDTFVPALKRLGFSSNSTDKKELETALDQLIEQKPLVYSYLVDESADEVVAGNASMALV